MPIVTDRIEITTDVYPGEYVGRYGRRAGAIPGVQSALDAQIGTAFQFIADLSPFASDLAEIGTAPQSQIAPFFSNGFFGHMDAVALYCSIAHCRPKHFFEIGSGNTTKFAALAKRNRSPETRIVTVDPAPRPAIHQVADEIHETQLENCDLTLFDRMEAGDILLFDGSHRVLPNSDVVVFFLELFPRIPPGVVICVDDIFLPWDYPEAWDGRMYSEQYMLAVLLREGGRNYEVLLPVRYLSQLSGGEAFSAWRSAIAVASVAPIGKSFWFRRRL